MSLVRFAGRTVGRSKRTSGARNGSRSRCGGLGAAALCPHTNTRFFQGAADDAVWLDGDLELLYRCDAILMTPDWRRSSGATAEHDFAVKHRKVVFYDMDTLKDWLNDEALTRRAIVNLHS